MPAITQAGTQLVLSLNRHWFLTLLQVDNNAPRMPRRLPRSLQSKTI